MYEEFKMPSHAEVMAIEERARVMRAQAMTNGFRAFGAAVGQLFGRLAGAVRGLQHS